MRASAALLGLTGLAGIALSTPIGVPPSDDDLQTLEKSPLELHPSILPYIFDVPIFRMPTPEEQERFDEIWEQMIRDGKDQGSISSHALEKRSSGDGVFAWQRPQPVIGKYPDGRLMCSIVTMTAGHIQGPCPPIVSPEEVRRILDAQYCREHCCLADGTSCAEK